MGEDIADRLQGLAYQGFSLNGFRRRRRRLACVEHSVYSGVS